MIKVESQLETDFHRQLATGVWLSTLSSRITDAIRSCPEFHTDKGAGMVRSRYNENRYMGPLSIVKYEFVVRSKSYGEILRRARTGTMRPCGIRHKPMISNSFVRRFRRLRRARSKPGIEQSLLASSISSSQVAVKQTLISLRVRGVAHDSSTLSSFRQDICGRL